MCVIGYARWGMELRPAGMDMIAQLSGVSKTTVHRALHNTGRISPQTRQHILDVAEQLGYRPNRLARSLRAHQTATLGVIVTNISGSFYAYIVESIERAAQQNRYSILLACSYRDPDREHDLVELLLEKQVDGLILSTADPHANSDYYTLLLQQGVRLVCIDRSLSGVEVDEVCTNHHRGGSLATHHLLSAGRRRIAFAAARPLKMSYSSSQSQLQGYEQALRETGAQQPIVLGQDMEDTPLLQEFGYRSILTYWRAGGRVDGVVATNDEIAYGIIHGLTEMGLQVPHDVGVVGFDDLDMSAYVHPPLTTIRQPMQQIGTEAVRLLLNQLKGTEHASIKQHVLLEPQLIVRQSCGAAQPALSDKV